MNFGLTEEQQILRNVARRFLGDKAPIAKVRDVMESPDAFDPDIWGAMADLGWQGLIVDGAHGGADLGWVDLIVLLEETGRGLLPSPLISTSLAGAAISGFGTDEQKARYLPSLADGSGIGTLAILEESDSPDAEGIQLAGAAEGGGYRLSGRKRFVHDAGVASLFVVPFRAGGAIRFAIIPASAEGVKADGLLTMDATKRMGDVALDDVTVGTGDLLATDGDGSAALAYLLDLGGVAARQHELAEGPDPACTPRTGGGTRPE